MSSLKKLEIHNFRNLQSQSLEISNKVTLVLGNNGQGKTSLLEAISLVSTGKSFRTSKNSDLVHWHKNEASVNALIETSEGDKEVSFHIKNGRKSLSVNGEKTTFVEGLFGQLNSVEFTPDNLNLVSGGPSLRRKFFDRIFSQTSKSYLGNLVSYNRALKERNASLSSAGSTDKDIKIWDEILAKYAKFLVDAREKNLIRFRDLFLNSLSFVNCYPDTQQRELASISFSSELSGMSEKEILTALETSLPVDRLRGRTTFGAHKDDYYIEFGRDELRQAKSFCSQGQTRSLAMALKFAAVEFIQELSAGEYPIILLDDVESELDKSRKEALYRQINNIPSQVVITATEFSSEAKSALENPQTVLINQGSIS